MSKQNENENLFLANKDRKQVNISSVPEGAAGGMGMSGHGSHSGHPGHVTQNNIGQGQKCKLE